MFFLLSASLGGVGRAGGAEGMSAEGVGKPGCSGAAGRARAGAGSAGDWNAMSDRGLPSWACA